MPKEYYKYRSFDTNNNECCDGVPSVNSAIAAAKWSVHKCTLGPFKEFRPCVDKAEIHEGDVYKGYVLREKCVFTKPFRPQRKHW